MNDIKSWFNRGTPWVWLTGGAVSISLAMVLGLLFLIASRGLGHFWPADVFEADYLNPDGTQQKLIGELVETESVEAARIRSSGIAVEEGVEWVTRWLVKLGNRDVGGQDFKSVIASHVSNVTTPEHLVVLERREWGNFYGFLKAVKEAGQTVAENDAAWAELEKRLQRTNQLASAIQSLEKHEIGAVNYKLERLRLAERRLQLKNQYDDAARGEIEAERNKLNTQFESLQGTLSQLRVDISRDSIIMEIADGQQREIPLAKIVQAYRPNSMNGLTKTGFYFAQLWNFLSDDPREANTEGGIFPAIFGTVLMVVLMTLVVTPFGVVAAVYMREYAKQGWVTKTIRIAVNNLAGVPSIVYGVFGLGFFVYFLGAEMDKLFFPEAAPAPVFGTPGLLWASVTLALLTVPVVIVSTEEGLARIPSSVREGSLALGATKFETLWKVVLPMSSPAMMTGLILAISRAAGEVAPLMLVGVVKLAPALPLDLNAPFLHLERKFMHLGFHIYDVGFQSPNVEAARPIVYATAVLLVIVIAILNLTAVTMRNRLRERYRALET
ncbi:MAG TPA: phosphate ABC transporter permease PstA [Pseudomonadales bacterium]|nr:phosphate ABC transporter permease PstA [Pseudomonadales bacterium]